MAEFKLGRIRFVYQGAWATGRAYVVDDVISVGGKSWICVVNHTASPLFATDQTFVPTRWNLLADGTNWKGDWTPETYYNIGGMVRYGGSIYVCIEAHESATYEPDADPELSYLGLEEDSEKWELFGTSLEWKTDWSVSTRYKVRDVVRYGGTTYVCNEHHISAATAADGLEVDQDKWDYFNQGITYLGEWQGDTPGPAVRYKINDVVKYGASTWICVDDHTSATDFDETKFDIFVEGQQFENTWSDATDYQIGDIVTYGGNLYVASQNNDNKNPVSETAFWNLFTTGFNFRSEWDALTNYKVGDVVRLGGYTYLAVDDSTDQTPPDTDYWARLNQGVDWARTDLEFLDVETSTTGTGINATFDVTRTGTSYSLVQNAPGAGYAEDDVLTILGTDVGGLSPANDITITVTSVNVVSVGVEELTVTHTGIAVTWAVGINYVLGDLVFVGASTYIAIQAHTSSLLNRPDADVTATYWNLFAAGSESAVLTTEGDTYYFGAQGPTRLPVGTDGQILRVSNGYPTWAYYGVINNLVYVAPTGTDSIETGWGLTIDKPWRSVRFACDQIRDGYQNRNAKVLLESNKLFIMREVTNWITYTYSVSITSSSSANNRFTADSTANLTANMPIEFTGTTGGVVAGTKYFVKAVISDTEFTISNTQGGTTRSLTSSTVDMVGALSYDSTFCERDVGYLVDAVAFDLSHGGNGKSTTAAKAYYTPAGSAYINSNFGEQITQTVAAYNYLKTIVENVLENTPVAVIYQKENGLTNTVEQFVSSTLVTEENTVATAQALLTIVTDGLLSRSGTAIPSAIFPQTTVSAKTGTFFEVLPIIIPNFTAVTGDELRSTVISPQPAIASLVNDKPKTISSLERLKEVLPNLVANNEIVVSPNNTQVQQYSYNNYESIASLSIETNVNTVASIVSTGTVPAFSIPGSVEFNSAPAYDGGYYNARRLLNANKAFLQAEVTAWIENEIATAAPSSTWDGFVYDNVSCERDVGYVVDALRYDLTYGGNLETSVAARSYYSLGTFVETGEKDQALLVWTYVKSIIDNIVTASAITPTTGNAETQDVSGTAGSAGAATFAQARIQEIYDTIDTGTEPTLIAPSTSWVDSRLVAANATFQAQKTALRASCIDWIVYNYPGLEFNQTLCSRDIGYMIDALGYDLMFNSNFRSIKAGMSYRRGIASTDVVLAGQLDATVGVIKYLGNQLQNITKGTSTLNVNLNEMTDIVANGLTSVPSFVLPNNPDTDIGYYNAARLVYANKAFIVAELSAWIYAQIAANTAPFNTGFTYGGNDQVKCERDVGYIVDALRFDLTYGGNLATVIAGRAYYTYSVYVGDADSKARALAVQLRIKDIIDNIATGNTAGWTETPANALTQDVSGTPGSAGAATFAQTRVQEIYDTINTGTTATTIAPSITWTAASLQTSFADIQAAKSHIQDAAIAWVNDTYPLFLYDATTCRRDVGYIVDAFAYDLVFGSNFLSAWNAMSYHRGLTSTGVVLDSQLRPTLGIIGYVGASVKEYATGLFGNVGSSVAASRINSSIDALYDVLNNGIDTGPSELITDPVGFDVNYSNARAQIANNYAFIKADVSQFIQNTYPAIWTALGASGQAACQRDVGYILDAIRYDLTYGGNTQSLIVGSSYYSYINLVIDSTELTATLAAYTHLKSIIDEVAQRLTSGPTAGNTTPQVVSGTGGNLAAATFAQDRVQDVIDWITNGTAPTAIAPDTSWVDTSLVNGFNRLQARKSEIQSDGLQYVHKFFQYLTFNEATCSRDIGYMIDALGYDMMFGSNFASVIAGKSYYRALASTQLVLSSQKEASLGLINFLRYKAKSIATGGGIAKISTTIDDIVGSINSGVVPRFLWPSYSTVDAENYAAAKLIWQNKNFIEAEIIQYITDNYPAVEYNKALCARDVGYIVDAIRYDLTYGGNTATRQSALAYYSQLTDALQIDAADLTATLAAYANLKLIVQDIANGGLSSYTPLQNVVSYLTGTGGDATSASTVGTLIQDVIDYIDDPVANPITESLASTSWVDPNLVAQNVLLQSNKTIIQGQITTFIGVNYPNLVYNSATCERDVGYIIDAIGYDLMFGSNYRSVKAGMSYYQSQASLVLSDQKRATVQSFRYLKELVVGIVFGNATGLASAKQNMLTIIDIIDKGIGSTPETVGTLSYMNDVANAHVAEILRINKTFLENEATAWIRDQYSSTVIETASTGVVTTSESHNFIVGDPVEFTSPIITTQIIQTSSTGNLITLRTTANVIPDMKFTVPTTGIGTLPGGTYYVLTVEPSNKVTISSAVGGTVVDPGNSAVLGTVTIGGIFGSVVENIQYFIASTPTTTTFTIKESILDTSTVVLSASEGTMIAQYSFDDALCKRDMGAYVDALVYDLEYPGNYKSTFAALLYNNAVAGSERSDMFWVSNATGLRNCTLRGLLGDLTAENDFGTKRPTAGAFVALNPGFGPNDSNVWVQTRSHYSQNVTMFGSGCSGAKIDSALHAGGNKSMVKNDFTTIISDGFGVWCTGADSLTELVSVFNYYGYAGYIAELGGRIRATNGNSSYGTYGVIAEGVASTEVPIYGYLDNRAAQAQVTNTVTDGVMEILRLEFGNAGSAYTNVDYTVNGSGYNAAAVGDEFRDGSVFETRIIDLDDDNGVGGTDYVNASNAAQSGDLVSISIAATDQALSAAYVGVRIQITAGTGVGQYANILTYETGSKVAKVFKDSFSLLTVTGSTTTVLQVASTSTLYVGMPIYLSGTTAGVLTANTVYYVESIPNTTTFTVEASVGSGAITGLTATSGQTITLYAAGWDHVVPGATIENTLDLTTTYIIEPRINYTVPGYTATARSLDTSATWNKITYGDTEYVAIASTGTTANFSVNGTTWAGAGALASSASWTDVVYGGGFGATATAVVGGLGGRGAVLQAVLGVPNAAGEATADQVASVTIIDGGQGYETPPVIVFTPTSGGVGATATCAVLDGKISSVTIAVPGSGYNTAPTVSAATDRVTHIIVNSWGRNYFSAPQVTLTGGGYSSQATVKSFGITISDSNITSGGVSRLIVNSQGAGYTSTPTVEILDTSAKYVAIANGSGDNCYTTSAGMAAGTAWTAGTSTGKTDLVSLVYGNGVYVAVGGASSAVSSTNGSLWLSRTIPTLGAGSYRSVTYGNGTFVAITTGSNATAYSANGTSWTAGGVLPTSSTWTSVAYGNGRFVAIASGGRLAAYSINKGLTWTASPAGLPSSQTWVDVSYGQGLFFAVAQSTDVAATSPDGVTWTVRAMPSSSNWNSIAFGNINNRPLWSAISSTSGVVAASVRTGAQALGRVKVASGIVTEVRMIEPGSSYPYGTVSATTVTSNLITVDNTVNLTNLQPVEFFGTDSGGLVNEITYYVIGSTITSTQFKVAATVADAIAGTAIILTTSTPTMTYRAGPIVTVTDPNNIANVGLRVRVGDGALGNPSFSDRGADNATATTDVNGDGYSDLFQVSTFVNVYDLSTSPTPGANVEFASIPGVYYKLVTVTNFVENQDYPGTYTATFQLNPGVSTLLAPKHGDRMTTRIKYSQVRLTGHDFLYIGTGGFEQTNYPNVDITTASQDNQAQFSAGGRVFFTSTDQDGNFNVGNLFGVQQATGTATLNASAFNLSGLNSLQLGSVELGIGSAIITQFSTDPFFTADSDSVVPTQRAIRAYITAQIGGGQSSLNVNTLTSGIIYIAGNSISTTSGAGINVTAKMNFTGGIDGAPVALGYFLTR